MAIHVINRDYVLSFIRLCLLKHYVNVVKTVKIAEIMDVIGIMRLQDVNVRCRFANNDVPKFGQLVLFT